MAHESLHLIFYDYLYTNYPKLRKNIENVKIWAFSEAFNVVIQEQPEWLDIFKIKPGVHKKFKKMYDLIKEEWVNNKNVDSVIDKIKHKL